MFPEFGKISQFFPLFIPTARRLGNSAKLVKNKEILTALDELEDYRPERPESENLYNRRQIEVYDQQERLLSWAWVYLMNRDLVVQLGGVVQLNGLWALKS